MNEYSTMGDADRLLSMLAERLSQDPTYMASLFAVYKRHERIDEEELARLLKVSQGTVTRLALCKRPNSSSANFPDQIRQLAAFARTDVTYLGNLIRHVDALESLRLKSPQETKSDPAVQPSSLLRRQLVAARDRSEIQNSGSSPSSDPKDARQGLDKDDTERA